MSSKMSSTASLPSYVANSLSHVPTYSAEPHAYEQTLAWTSRYRGADFVKQSKGGSVSLRLKDQEENAVLPVYGYRATISGTVDLTKPEGILSVEVKVGTQLSSRGPHVADDPP